MNAMDHETNIVKKFLDLYAQLTGNKGDKAENIKGGREQ